ncbi:spermatogenesis-associated protein 22 [Tiliqua scincoides]|uniref:spermatogenesis-associated protein 22 n=1 Tax=Tiliqua scincoides TaxID=71010 RepID=UPI00346323DF
MKRNFNDSSTRNTAGCLPVPLFNQKKRNRQPLTSNPLKNEPSTSNSANTLDFSTMLTDFGWETTKPEPTKLQKTSGTKLEENNARANAWKRNDYPAFGNRTENRMIPALDDSLDCVMGTEFLEQQELLPGHPKASQSTKAGAREHNYSAAVQQPVGSNAMLKGLQGQSTSYKFKHNLYQQKVNPNNTYHTQVDKKIQNVPEYQLKLKEKDNSLRILSVVIESMKHWSQYTNKIPLLFEVMGILDSAVTPGQYGAKTFLLRDGKESVSCVFYETDRELPRLIRGRAHRCMGNYDTKQKLFRCVSVRPATVLEQQTFQDFVKIADAEMSEYVKRSNEV